MKDQIIPYKPYLKKLAQQLRLNSTLSEVLLWNELKQKKMYGYDFDRQKPIDAFIVDFYCKKLKLAIEIDGDSHNYQFEEDMVRQKKLEALGVNFLRFYDEEVKHDINNVLCTISFWILDYEEKTQRVQTHP